MKRRSTSSIIISYSGEWRSINVWSFADAMHRDADIRKQKETESSLNKMTSAFKQVRLKGIAMNPALTQGRWRLCLHATKKTKSLCKINFRTLHVDRVEA